jgi:Fe2+ or Zn2+ uptake regulation protein
LITKNNEQNLVRKRLKLTPNRIEKLVVLLKNENWINVVATSAEQKYLEFNDRFINILNNFIPVVNIKINNKNNNNYYYQT